MLGGGGEQQLKKFVLVNIVTKLPSYHLPVDNRHMSLKWGWGNTLHSVLVDIGRYGSMMLSYILAVVK